MFKITSKERLAPGTVRIGLSAPQIAKKACPGQFVVVIVDPKGERIPLTLADWHKEKGIIFLIIQEAGFSSRRLAACNIGDAVEHVLGPLGQPTKIENLGRLVCVGGGVGIAEVFPVARAFKAAGNQVIGIIGARTRELLILENELKQVCDELQVATDDGSFGRKGFVTDILKDQLAINHQPSTINLVYAIGPPAMMRAISELTLPYKIKTIVSLNPIMLDATGMCGACRCLIEGKIKFACVEGPDFDAHQVDFDDLQNRLNQFKGQEQRIIDFPKQIR